MLINHLFSILVRLWCLDMPNFIVEVFIALGSKGILGCTSESSEEKNTHTHTHQREKSCSINKNLKKMIKDWKGSKGGFGSLNLKEIENVYLMIHTNPSLFIQWGCTKTYETCEGNIGDREWNQK